MDKTTTVLFARSITAPVLAEYANSFTMRVVWVHLYSALNCAQHIHQDVTDVYFMQLGPGRDLVDYLKQRNITMHLINTEQMSRVVMPQTPVACKHDDCESETCDKKVEEVAFPFDQYVFRYLQGPQPICSSVTDYCVENLNILMTHVSACVDLRLHCFVPESQSTTNAQNDIVFVGDASSKHRKQVLKQLRGIRVLERTFGATRDAVLQTYKVLLNIHFGPSYCIFEELRCVPCVLSKVIVVSEDSRLDPKHPIVPFIVFAPHHALAAKANDVLANYDVYFDKLFVKQQTLFEQLPQNIKHYENKYARC